MDIKIFLFWLAVGIVVCLLAVLFLMWVENMKKWSKDLRLAKQKVSELGLSWHAKDLRTALVDEASGKVTIWSTGRKYFKVKPLSMFEKFKFGELVLYYNPKEEVAFLITDSERDNVTAYVFGKQAK